MSVESVVLNMLSNNLHRETDSKYMDIYIYKVYNYVFISILAPFFEESFSSSAVFGAVPSKLGMCLLPWPGHKDHRKKVCSSCLIGHEMDMDVADVRWKSGLFEATNRSLRRRKKWPVICLGISLQSWSTTFCAIHHFPSVSLANAQDKSPDAVAFCGQVLCCDCGLIHSWLVDHNCQPSKGTANIRILQSHSCRML